MNHIKKALAARVTVASILLVLSLLSLVVLLSLGGAACAVGTKAPKASAPQSSVSLIDRVAAIESSIGQLSGYQANQSVSIKQIQSDITAIKSDITAIKSKLGAVK